jgi:hypothetical protein
MRYPRECSSFIGFLARLLCAGQYRSFLLFDPKGFLAQFFAWIGRKQHGAESSWQGAHRAPVNDLPAGSFGDAVENLPSPKEAGKCGKAVLSRDRSSGC